MCAVLSSSLLFFSFLSTEISHTTATIPWWPVPDPAVQEISRPDGEEQTASSNRSLIKGVLGKKKKKKKKLNIYEYIGSFMNIFNIYSMYIFVHMLVYIRLYFLYFFYIESNNIEFTTC